MSHPISQAAGVDGQIELHSDKVRILRKGVVAFLSHGLKGDKNVLLSSIRSIQFKNEAVFTGGHIRLSIVRDFLQTSKENTVDFRRDQQAVFERIKEQIESHIQANTTPLPTLSAADDIAKFASLRDKELLTDAEFQAKKRQLLGLSPPPDDTSPTPDTNNSDPATQPEPPTRTPKTVAISQPGLTAANYSRIRIGMTKADAIRMLGEEYFPETKPTEGDEALTWPGRSNCNCS